MNQLCVGSLLHAGSSELIPLLVLVLEIEPQTDNDHDKQAVAAQVRCKGNEVPWLVRVQENLGSYSVRITVSKGSSPY